MKRRCAILIVVSLGLVLAGSIWALPQPPEPAYRGQSLTYWLEHYFSPPANSSGGISILIPNPAAVEAIRQIGTNAIPTLLRMAEAHDSPLAWEQNRQATLGFRGLGAAASNAVPALIKIFEAKPSRWSQEEAANALAGIGPTARGAVPALCSALASANSSDRIACVLALGRIHAEPGQAVPVLIKSLNDPHPGVRQLATEALGSFGPDAQPAIPALIEIFDRNTAESSHAATALGLIGPAARAAVPPLLRGLADTNLDVEFRQQRIMALGQIHAEPELVVPALMKSLSETISDSDVRIRLFSTIALGQFGPDAKPAVPLLTSLLQDPNRNVRSDATNALRLIDSSAAAGSGIK